MNFLKTTILLAALTGLLVAVGGFIGGTGGAILFLIFAGIMNFFAYWFSDRVALAMAGARQISEADYPRLFQMVREVARAAGMPMPRVYIVENPSPNAFATGRDPKHAVVAVTTGILRLLNERELRAVIGHEMGHVKNRDILTSSIVATIAGAISMIAQVLMFTSLFGGGGRDRNPFAALAVILLAPIAATLLQLGISRSREYAADETGARITRDPLALASALEKLKMGIAAVPMEPTPAQEAVSALYIANPFRGEGLANLFSTHPPLDERIRRL
ncbi:MAG: zinc metalloprotease HtpX, partial [Tepidiforma sp.]